jgi:hypothetical protein
MDDSNMMTIPPSTAVAAAGPLPNIIEDDHQTRVSPSANPREHQTRAVVRDDALESTTSAVVEEEWDEECGNLQDVIPPSAAGGDEHCTRQRCLQDSATPSTLTMVRAGDHDKESVDVQTTLDSHASDWTTFNDDFVSDPSRFEKSANVESLHEAFDEVGMFTKETANSEAAEDRKCSPQERQLLHELNQNDESIQLDRDFAFPLTEQKRRREAAWTMEQGISDAPAHCEEPAESEMQLSPQEIKFLYEFDHDETTGSDKDHNTCPRVRPEVPSTFAGRVGEAATSEFNREFSLQDMNSFRETRWDEDFAFALAEQETETDVASFDATSHDKPAGLEEKLSSQEVDSLRQLYHGGEPSISDECLALTLAERERQDAENDSITGRAWSFVQAVIAEHGQTSFAPSSDAASFSEYEDPQEITVRPVTDLIGTDDMLFMVERMIELRELFEAEKKNTRVDIGFHYTRSSNLERIRENGLLTKAERDDRGVNSNYNGSTYGDGIYTGNNPFAFRTFGDICLLVARLRGWSEYNCAARPSGRPDTLVVRPDEPGEMVILAQSSQCVPLASFSAHHIDNEAGRKKILSLQDTFQKLLDCFFNLTFETTVPKWGQLGDNSLPIQASVFPTLPGTASFASTAASNPSIPNHRSVAPDSLGARDPSIAAGRPVAPDPPVAQQTSAASCNEKLGTTAQQSAFSLSKWRRANKRVLGMSYADQQPRPVIPDGGCDKSLTITRELDGSSASTNEFEEETMRMSKYPKGVLCCDGTDAIVIVYTFHTMDNVSRRTHRIAFLPFGPESQDLLLRLQYTFRVGMIDAATWNIIPHRQSPYVAYPNYALVCNQALDAMGIPFRDALSPTTNSVDLPCLTSVEV